ncbi:MAG TPA: hypothetical protein VNX68_09285, partial [Nitrosopumilaceae archaeon]|nr:hypothetical protein [Nitrosopumilaceae archaeon]
HIARISQHASFRNDNNKTLTRDVNLYYGTLFYQYAIIYNRRWELRIPIEIGFGTCTIHANDSTGNTWKGYPVNGSIIPVGAGLDVTYNLFSWMGLNTMGGYRYIANPYPKLNYNGFFYMFGIQIIAGEIYRRSKYTSKKREFRKKVEIINNSPGK